MHWVDELASEQARIEDSAALEGKSEALAAVTVSSAMPGYWKSLVSELSIAVERLNENKNLRFFASLSDHSEPEFESRLRLQIVLQGYSPLPTYTDIFHLVGTATIRCNPLHGKPYQLLFGQRIDGTVGVYPAHGNPVIMSAERAAQYVVEPMVKMTRKGL